MIEKANNVLSIIVFIKCSHSLKSSSILQLYDNSLKIQHKNIELVYSKNTGIKHLPSNFQIFDLNLIYLYIVYTTNGNFDKCERHAPCRVYTVISATVFHRNTD